MLFEAAMEDEVGIRSALQVENGTTVAVAAFFVAISSLGKLAPMGAG